MQQHDINEESALDRAFAKNRGGNFASMRKLGQSQG